MQTTKENYFWLLVLLYMVNDLLFMVSNSYWYAVFIDYSVRIVTVGALFWLYKNYYLPKNAFYLHPYPYKKALLYGAALTIFGAVLFRLIEVNLTSINFYKGYAFPEIDNTILFWFDMSAGLLLVAVSEELLFHAYFYAIFKEKLSNTNLILLSSLLFAAIHWSNDLTNILGVFIWGLVTMQLFIRVRTLWPLILGHLGVNIVLFSKVLPDAWFVVS